MASSPPSSVKSEPTGVSYSANEQNLSYTSMYDTSIENTLPSQTDQIPGQSSSIFIDAPALPSNDTPYDLLQGFSAPTLPVYINMGMNERADDVNFGGSRTTTDAPLSRSLAAIDVDRPISSGAMQRHSHHHHHHFPHHSQNRNRYPYLQRPTSTKVLNKPQLTSSTIEALPYYEQRPAFRRSYFALRRPRIPKGTETNQHEILLKIFFLAPPMPKHLFPGFKQNRTVALTNEIGGDSNENEDEEEGNFRNIIEFLEAFYHSVKFLVEILYYTILSLVRNFQVQLYLFVVDRHQ